MTASAQAVAAQALAVFDDPLLRYEWSPPGLGGMSDAQRAVHVDPSRLRWLIAGTQLGKTRISVAEVWWHARGRHPFREVLPAPHEGWVMLPDLDGDWPKYCHKLHEVEPLRALHRRCRYDRARGYRYGQDRLLVLSGGTVVRPKSGTQQLQVLEGESLAWAAVDEVPRKEHWFAILQRVTALHGDAWLTLTAVGRPAGYLRDYLEGNDDEGIEAATGWSKHRIKLTPGNVPHRPSGWVQDQIDLMDPWEVAQRRDAEWDGPAQGRRFPAWHPRLVVGDEVVYGLEYDRFRVGIDHGEGIGKQQVALVGMAQRRTVVIRMWKSTSTDCSARSVAQAIVGLLKPLKLTPHHIERIVGDINTVGLGIGGGIRFNALVEQALAKEMGLRSAQVQVDSPSKGRGSVLAGESAMNAEMREGDFLVHSSCTPFIDAAKAYTGKEAGLKDAIDTVRYAIADVLLDPAHRAPQPVRPIMSI